MEFLTLFLILLHNYYRHAHCSPRKKKAKLDDPPNADALREYSVCPALEKAATTDENRVHARILGHLILHAPFSIALSEVVRAIHSCTQDEKKLLELGEYFRLWFILPCMFLHSTFAGQWGSSR